MALAAACATPIATPRAAPAPAAPAAAPALPEPVAVIPARPAPRETPADSMPPVQSSPPAPPKTNEFQAWFDGLRAASCLSGAKGMKAPKAVDLTVRPVTLDRLGAGRKTIGDLSFVGGFQLTADSDRFGGLSGLDMRDDGGLLAVSDNGAFVWIDLAKDGVTPVAARLSALRNEAGESFANKADADAEGLALIDGVALVSFEQDHRVLAFDVATCGAGARAAPVLKPQGAIQAALNRRSIAAGANTGVEALAVTRDGMLFAGVEQLNGGAAPLSVRAMEGAPDFAASIGAGSPDLVGMDVLESADGRTVRVYSLHRTPAVMGDAIVVLETEFTRWVDASGLPARPAGDLKERAAVRYRKTSERKLAGMGALLLNIDNFEGIAVRETPDGRIRLYLVSDDNFSTSQRTLLMVFEIR